MTARTVPKDRLGRGSAAEDGVVQQRERKMRTARIGSPSDRKWQKGMLDRIERSLDEEGIEPAASCKIFCMEMRSKRSTPELHAREGAFDVESEQTGQYKEPSRQNSLADLLSVSLLPPFLPIAFAASLSRIATHTVFLNIHGSSPITPSPGFSMTRSTALDDSAAAAASNISACTCTTLSLTPAAATQLA